LYRLQYRQLQKQQAVVVKLTAVQPNYQAVTYSLPTKNSLRKAVDILPLGIVRNLKAVESRPLAVQFVPKAVEVTLLACNRMVSVFCCIYKY